MTTQRTPSALSAKQVAAVVVPVICLLILLAIGCNELAVARNFEQTVQVAGQSVMRIQCDYVGKQPLDPKSYKSKHDYRRMDTDFYKVTFENLTDNEIVVEGVDYAMARGPVLGRKSWSADSIKINWGTNVIQAKGSIKRDDHLVWSKGPNNALVKTYSFRTTDNDGKQVKFKAAVRLAYRR